MIQEGDRQPGGEGYPGDCTDLRCDGHVGGIAPGPQTVDWCAAEREALTHQSHPFMTRLGIERRADQLRIGRRETRRVGPRGTRSHVDLGVTRRRYEDPWDLTGRDATDDREGRGA